MWRMLIQVVADTDTGMEEVAQTSTTSIAADSTALLLLIQEGCNLRSSSALFSLFFIVCRHIFW